MAMSVLYANKQATSIAMSVLYANKQASSIPMSALYTNKQAFSIPETECSPYKQISIPHTKGCIVLYTNKKNSPHMQECPLYQLLSACPFAQKVTSIPLSVLYTSDLVVFS